MIPSSYCVALTSHVAIFLSHLVDPFFFSLIFDGTILTLCSTNIICDHTFVHIGGSLIFFSHLTVLLSHLAVPISHLIVHFSHLLVLNRGLTRIKHNEMGVDSTSKFIMITRLVKIKKYITNILTREIFHMYMPQFVY